MSYSPIEIRGDEKLAVKIKAENSENPFGVLAVLGNESNSCKVKIDYLDISGGSDAFLNGVFYNGALSIHYCDADIRHSRIHNNAADDGVNIKFSRLLINDVLFETNAFDNLDLDFCTGEIKNSVFKHFVKSN